MFWVFLQICDQCFNPYTAKQKYLGFSSIGWFLKFFRYFMWVLEARTKLIFLFNKFLINKAIFSESSCTSLKLRSKRVQRNYRDFFEI